MSELKKGSFSLSFVLGVAAGAAAALLLAPARGQDTRRLLRERSQGLRDRGDAALHGVVSRSSGAVEQGRAKMTSTVSRLKARFRGEEGSEDQSFEQDEERF